MILKTIYTTHLPSYSIIPMHQAWFGTWLIILDSHWNHLLHMYITQATVKVSQHWMSPSYSRYKLDVWEIIQVSLLRGIWYFRPILYGRPYKKSSLLSRHLILSSNLSLVLCYLIDLMENFWKTFYKII